MEKCGRPPLPPSKDPKVQAKREKARVPESEKKGKCGRKPLPPSDDPKVQARREKSRAAAQKKREGVKQVKAETKASTTINQAVKMKIARKAMAAAKAAKTPAPAPAPAKPAKVVKPRAPRKSKAPAAAPAPAPAPAPAKANEKWDERGFTTKTYKMKEERLFFETNWISPYTEEEDPLSFMGSKAGKKYFKDLDKYFRGDIMYKWSDNFHIKDEAIKKEMEMIKEKAIKFPNTGRNRDKGGFDKWDENKSRVLILEVEKGNDKHIFWIYIVDTTSSPAFVGLKLRTGGSDAQQISKLPSKYMEKWEGDEIAYNFTYGA